MSARQDHIAMLTRLIQQSPFQILSSEDVSSGIILTQGEFEARAQSFVNDAESGIPGDADSIALAKALLAKRHRAHLPRAVARAYMAPLASMSTTALPKGRRQSVIRKS